MLLPTAYTHREKRTSCVSNEGIGTGSLSRQQSQPTTEVSDIQSNPVPKIFSKDLSHRVIKRVTLEYATA